MGEPFRSQEIREESTPIAAVFQVCPLRLLVMGGFAGIRQPCCGIFHAVLYHVSMNTSVADLYFMEARSKLLDIAAFLDRLERSGEERDHRTRAFDQAVAELPKPGGDRVRRILMLMSDPTTEPIAKAGMQGATGAWPGEGK